MSTASTAWCRMNDCYRTTQTDSDFCAKHGWNQPPLIFQNVEREPQTKHSTGDGTVAGNETPVSSTPAAGGSTSRSAQLTDHLHGDDLLRSPRRPPSAPDCGPMTYNALGGSGGSAPLDLAKLPVDLLFRGVDEMLRQALEPLEGCLVILRAGAVLGRFRHWPSVVARSGRYDEGAKGSGDDPWTAPAVVQPDARRLAPGFPSTPPSKNRGPRDLSRAAYPVQGQRLNVLGRLLDIDGTVRWWKRCIEAADVRYRNPHMARHSFVARLREKSVRIEDIKWMVGHESIATTEDIYSHPNMDELGDRVRSLVGDRV